MSGDWRGRLATHGWVIVPGVGSREDAEALLGELGELLEQYDGVVRHEVKAQPGFDHLQYTYSRNGITPHTEAPGMAKPPRYLALHCHRQARCGGGQTLLADGYAFVDSLGGQLAAEARERPVRFDLVPGAGPDAIAAPIYTKATNGTPPVVRYSYSVLRDNSLAAPTHEDELDLAGLEPFKAELCRRGVEFVRDRGARALAPDGGVMVFDNWRVVHARAGYKDPERHLTRYWVG